MRRYSWVIPLALATAGLIWHRSPEAVWAARGVAAGLVAVAAYDAVRMPLVWSNIWPDFIPTLGCWITGAQNGEMLFRLTPASFSLSLLGHLIYGSVLGVFLSRIVRAASTTAFDEVPAAITLPTKRSESASSVTPQHELAA
jgi:hypothetical protein